LLTSDYTIEPMEIEDLKEVLAIEKAVFPHPWSENFFRLIISDKNNCMVTIKLGGRVIGYGGYHLLKNDVEFRLMNKRYDIVVHLINIAIAPDFQGMGYGTILMNYLLEDARSRGVEFAYLEVRPSNERAISLYRRFGFMIVGIIENYYPQERENALVMGLDIV